MEPITLLAIGAAIYFFMTGRGSDEPTEEVAELKPEAGDEPKTGVFKIGKLFPVVQPIPAQVSPGSGGSGTGGGSNLGNPPNVSGHQDGYNANLFPDHKSVRLQLANLGYLQPGQVTDYAPPTGVVLKFQKDYNTAAAENFAQATGHLLEDDVPGEYTLRALEIATHGTDGYQVGDDLVRRVEWGLRFNG